MEWAAIGTAIVLVVAPAAATRAWLREGPGAMLAILLTLTVAVSAFVAARVMRNARADAADPANGAESGG